MVPSPGPQFVFTVHGSKFLFTGGPCLQFAFTGPGPNLYLPALAPNLCLPTLNETFHLPVLVPKLYLQTLAPAIASNLYLPFQIKILLPLPQPLVQSLPVIFKEIGGWLFLK